MNIRGAIIISDNPSSPCFPTAASRGRWSPASEWSGGGAGGLGGSDQTGGEGGHEHLIHGRG
jgi:hypothetical protein